MPPFRTSPQTQSARAEPALEADRLLAYAAPDIYPDRLRAAPTQERGLDNPDGRKHYHIYRSRME